ncbi:1-deoxy-D-xylulose-5-phosphate synthase [Candidatus Xianfuyuplasma coldseepsis]|uniref:1-deoxy-D-xylulose-5-phosphate synthase n=1 Tax=Candidatus Xianfuyuplasma coldseepsis TaxID=2782163 RepID=A0A7L7KSJ7_9MOLU|nr:1-deoxy-D-xylulose-5-phosphate synthase [Xianfuyuplasma coldseepsis]QMS85687.1 1-deoxy-D-xylulose-5-phosphate synthase [Xianfuyuplasma coldseepsis]
MDLYAIKDPSFLNDLTVKELETLSEEIRSFLIETIAKTGGHFSSNLGVVELTVALHKVFDSPNDKLIFDVGHQAYTHKILTGRAKDFSSLRQYQGLSGYLKRSESIHDIYEAGHSSTSIAAAAGIEFAKQYVGNSHKVVTIIGDGALTGGMAFEALNFLGNYSDHQPIIILNDNEMSISENIGYLSSILNDIRSKSVYRKVKSKTMKWIPKFLRRLTSKVERGIKGFLSNNTLFDDLGFSYYGPINGHNMKELLKYLNIAKRSNKPCVIHVLTEKGKGYKYSEQDQLGLWHGVSPFDVTTGVINKSVDTTIKSWSEIIGDYMIHYANIHEKFAIVVPAMIAGSGLIPFKNQHPDRIYDVGIAEQLAVTMSSGLAISGVDVFCPIYSTFIQRAYDQVNHDVARQHLKVVFGLDRAGIVGADGETHQGVFDIPLLRPIPGMSIAHPRTVDDAYKVLNYAFTINQGPFVIRYERGKMEVPNTQVITNEVASLAWEILKQGSDAIFLSFGSILDTLLDRLQTENLSITVVNATFIKPLDGDMITTLIQQNKPLIIYEESSILGGFGSSILEFCNQHQLPTTNIHLMGIPEQYVAHGTKQELLHELNLDVDSIIELVHTLVQP